VAHAVRDDTDFAEPQPDLTRPAARGRAYRDPVECSKELHDDIAAGDITVSFRLWRRPHARVGGRYRVGRAEIVVDTVQLIPFGEISAVDVRRAGEADREALRRRAAHAGPINDETLLYRIAFHVVG
jgi:ASCH domain